MKRENGNHTYSAKITLKNLTKGQKTLLIKLLDQLEANGVEVKDRYEND